MIATRSLLLLLLMLVAPCVAQTSLLDLHEYGFSDTLQRRGFDQTAFWLSASNGQVVALDSGIVGISFVVERDGQPALSVHDKSAGGRWLFRTLLYDRKLKKVAAIKDWGTAYPNCKIMRATGGTLIVQNNDQVVATKDLNTRLWSLSVPLTDVYRGTPYADISLSLSGNTLYVVSDQDKNNRMLTAYSVDGPQEKWKSKTGYYFRSTATDREFAYSVDKSGTIMVVGITEKDPPRSMIQPGRDNCLMNLQFIDTERLLTGSNCKELDIFSLDGKLLITKPLGRETITGAKSATGGTVIGVKLSLLKGRSGWRDSFDHETEARFQLLESESLKELGSLKLDPTHHSIRGWDVDFDGTAIFYIEDGILKVWNSQ